MTNDDMQNNLVATGALFAILRSSTDTHRALTSITMPGDDVSNQIDITFSFLHSPYRLTVERVVEPDQT